ncbi:MAG TPA: VOC family protein [Dehalococcoidia bacterium]|nr:VOC family protein [Dehalococcoidia bacterium]
MVNAPREVGGLTLPAINHIGVVVHNRDEAIRRYAESLGIGPFRAFDAEFPDLRATEGTPPSRLRIAFGNLGVILFEVIEPGEGPSIHRDFLERHGEGIQHIGFVVPDLAADLAKLEANGLNILLHAAIPGFNSMLVYVEGEAAHGAIVELIQESPEMLAFYQRLWDRTRRPA